MPSGLRVIGDAGRGFGPATASWSVAAGLLLLALTVTTKAPPRSLTFVAEVIVMVSGTGVGVGVAEGVDDVDEGALVTVGHCGGTGVFAPGQGLSGPIIGGFASGGVTTFPGT